MEINEIIHEDRIVILDNPIQDKQELLKEVLDRSVKNTELEKCRADLWKTLLEREKSMSTGIGLGVAIPHCSSDYVTDVKGFLVLLKNGIEFQAVDDKPVKIIVLLLLPKNKFEKHIKTLASIARLFNDKSFRDRILEAQTPQEAFAVINAEAEARAKK